MAASADLVTASNANDRFSESTRGTASTKEDTKSFKTAEVKEVSLETSSIASAHFEHVGVYNAEIHAKYYSTKFRRILIFFSLFCMAFAFGLDHAVRTTFQTLATSSYQQHSLLSTVTCINKVIQAAAQIWYARAADMFGRPTILVLSVLFYSMGSVIESQAYDVTRFAAGSCIFALGHSGIILTAELYVADFSNLNWRVTAAAAQTLPNVITTWISGNVQAGVGDDWSWGIGMWAFIMPLACVPLTTCILHMKYLAWKNGDPIKSVFQKPDHQSWFEYLIDLFFWRLDIVGLILLVAIFGLILVPLTVAGGLNNKWKTANILVPEILGWILAIPLYLIWEWKISRYPLTPWPVIKDRGIWSPMLISMFQQFAYSMQDTYFVTVLLVAVNQSKTSTTRIRKLFSFTGVLTGFTLGFVVAKVRRTKEFIGFGIAIWFLAFGLMEHFRVGLSAKNGIIAAMVMLGFGNGFILFPGRASIQASAYTHQMMAVATSLYLAVSNLGTAFGSAVSGTIWSNVLPHEIEKRITNNSTLVDFAYDSPTKFIKKYDWNSKERQAVVAAYDIVQRLLIIVALCLLVPLVIAALFLRNRRLESALAFDKVDETSENSSDLSENTNAKDNV